MQPLFVLIFVLLGTFWGSNFMYMKWITEVISPEQTVFIRALCGAIPLFLYAYWKGLTSWEHLRYWYHYLTMSILTISFAYFCYAAGTALLPSGIAGMLSGSIPIFTFIASYFFLKSESITQRKLGGVIVGFLGIFLIAKPWQTTGDISVLGVTYVIVGSLSIGLSFIYARRNLSGLGISAIALSAYQLTFAALTMLIFIDIPSTMDVFDSPKAAWASTLGLGLVGTGIAQMLYYYLIDKLGAVTASSATYLPPVVAMLIGYAFLDEALGMLDLIALVCIFLGVFLLREIKRKAA